MGVMTSIETVMVVILLSLLCNYDKLILKLHKQNHSCLDGGWLLLADWKVKNVSGMSVVLIASKNKSVKIHECGAMPWIKSYNSY